jgi:oligopeptide transport system permease protein
MLRYILFRCLQAIPVLLIVISITFILIKAAPGGPFDSEKTVPAEILQKLNERYHLDDPLFIQLSEYIINILNGDFGPSFKYPGRSVNELIGNGLPITLELGLYAILFALLLGVVSGLVASTRPNTLRDYVPMSLAMTGICLPSFVLGPVLLLVFSIWLEWFPVFGWGQSSGDKILPTITLGSTYAAYIARLTRGGMLDILTQDFIRTARAKGLSEATIILKHGLKGGMIPVISFLGPAMAGLLSGSFVVESIFQIPGLGRFYIQAAFNRDYTMILGTTIFFATLIIIFNLLSDILAAWLNPRIRYSNHNS